MKNVIAIFVALLFMTTTAEAKGSAENKTPALTKEQASEEFAKHLVVVDSMYKVNLTETQALKLGISKSKYWFNVEHTAIINEALQKAIENGEPVVFLNQDNNKPITVNSSKAQIVDAQSYRYNDNCTREQAYEAFSEHLSVNNSLYNVDITEKQAAKLGISKSQYWYFVENINNVNEIISDGLRQGKTFIFNKKENTLKEVTDKNE